MKITIEHDGYWWDYTVASESKELMGCNKTLEGVLEAVLESATNIKETPRNTRRNP